MNYNRALVIDKEKNNIFLLISENHGKIKIQSDYLANNFPALNRGFFITYEFLDNDSNKIIYSLKKIHKPDNVSLYALFTNDTVNFDGMINLFLFLLNYFLYEGFCTKYIIEESLKLTLPKNNYQKILFNIIFYCFELIDNEKINQIIIETEKNFIEKNCEILFKKKIISIFKVFSDEYLFNNLNLLKRFNIISNLIITNELVFIEK